MKKLFELAALAAVLTTASFSVAATDLIINEGECVLELASGQAVSIDPNTGDVSATVSNLEECVGEPDPPVINSFTRSPSGIIEPGDQVTLSWSSDDATTCEGSGSLPGWSGQKALQGSQALTLANEGTFTATLTCANSSGEDAKSLSITVDDDTGGGSCAIDSPPPNGLARASDAIWDDSSANGRFWNGVFIGNFPGTSNSRRYFQQSGRYHAIKFNSGAIPADMQGHITAGEMDGGGYATNVSLGRRIVTFSECPGDFHQSQLPAGCYQVDGTGTNNIAWGGSDFEGHPFRCALKPNTDYYMNIVYTNSPAGDPNPNWQCTGPKPNCGALMSSLHNSSPSWP